MFRVGPGQENPAYVRVGALFLQSPQLLSMPQVVPLLSPCLTPILHFTHSICPGGAKEAASLAPASHTSPGLRTEAKGEVERKRKQVQWSRSISYGLGAVTAPPISKRPLQMPSRPCLLPSSSRAAYLPSSRSQMEEGRGKLFSPDTLFSLLLRTPESQKEGLCSPYQLPASPEPPPPELEPGAASWQETLRHRMPRLCPPITETPLKTAAPVPSPTSPRPQHTHILICSSSQNGCQAIHRHTKGGILKV